MIDANRKVIHKMHISNELKKLILNNRNNIILYNIDAIDMMQNIEYNKHILIYIDPPYYDKADSLYNYYY